jgi:hypothetical protein
MSVPGTGTMLAHSPSGDALTVSPSRRAHARSAPYSSRQAHNDRVCTCSSYSLVMPIAPWIWCALLAPAVAARPARTLAAATDRTAAWDGAVHQSPEPSAASPMAARAAACAAAASPASAASSYWITGRSASARPNCLRCRA